MDITLPENSTWYERYKFDIPVFHLNGKFLMMHRVNISKLEKQLQKLEQQGTGGWWKPTWSSTLAVQKASSWGNGRGLVLPLSLSHSPKDVLNLVVPSQCWHSSSDWWKCQCGNYLPFGILQNKRSILAGRGWWRAGETHLFYLFFSFVVIWKHLTLIGQCHLWKKALHPCCCPKGLTF